MVVPDPCEFLSSNYARINDFRKVSKGSSLNHAFFHAKTVEFIQNDRKLPGGRPACNTL